MYIQQKPSHSVLDFWYMYPYKCIYCIIVSVIGVMFLCFLFCFAFVFGTLSHGFPFSCFLSGILNSAHFLVDFYWETLWFLMAGAHTITATILMLLYMQWVCVCQNCQFPLPEQIHAPCNFSILHIFSLFLHDISSSFSSFCFTSFSSSVSTQPIHEAMCPSNSFSLSIVFSLSLYDECKCYRMVDVSLFFFFSLLFLEIETNNPLHKRSEKLSKNF